MKIARWMRRLAWLTVAVLVLISVGMHTGVKKAYAAGWSYSVNDDGSATLTKYTGSETSVTIPKTIDGKTVSAIGNGSGCIFSTNKTTVTYVSLPAQNVTLNKNAFLGCTKLTTVGNSKYAVTISPGCFSGCTSLSSFTFSSSVTVLGDSTFRNTALKEVVLPASVRSLQKYVFGSCSQLKKVTIANSNCSFLDNTVFSGTSGLTICAPSGSTAQTYASKNGYGFTVYSGSSSSGGSSSGSSGSGSSGGAVSGGSSSCNHNWIFKSLAQTATCKKLRMENQYCTRCGATRVHTIEGSMIAHNPGAYEVIKKATSTTDGYKVAYCMMCGDEVERVVIPAYGSGSGSSGSTGDGGSTGSTGDNSSTGGNSSGGSTSGSEGSSGSAGSAGSTGGSTSDSTGSSGGNGSSGSSGGSSGSGGNASSGGNTSGGSSQGGNSNLITDPSQLVDSDKVDKGEDSATESATGSQLSGVENMIDTSVGGGSDVKKLPLPLIIGAVVVILGAGWFIMSRRNR